jgi:maltose O-acetyltransferase
MTRSEKEKMLSSELYRPSDPEIQRDLAATSDWISRYNTSPLSQRKSLLVEKLDYVGDDVEVRLSFFCDYGFNIKLGAGVFINSTVSSSTWSTF